MIVVDTARELIPHIGSEMGVSEWISLTQADIATFARVTGDDHWLHTDPVRAATEAPFGGVVAHGFLALSLVTALSRQCYDVGSAARWLNYGLDKIRFTAPVLPDQRLRLRLTLSALQPGTESTRIDLHCVLESEGAARPALVADWIVLVFEDGTAT